MGRPCCKKHSSERSRLASLDQHNELWHSIQRKEEGSDLFYPPHPNPLPPGEREFWAPHSYPWSPVAPPKAGKPLPFSLRSHFGEVAQGRGDLRKGGEFSRHQPLHDVHQFGPTPLHTENFFLSSSQIYKNFDLHLPNLIGL